MIRLTATAVPVLILFALASNLSAFDDSRIGYTAALGAGAGITQLSFKSRIGFQADSRVGYGLSERVQLWCMVSAAWFGDTEVVATPYNRHWDPYWGWIYDYTYSTRDVTREYSFVGLGMSYFLRSKSPSPYLLCGFGRSLVYCPTSVAGFGKIDYTGVLLGCGFEFAKHWLIEVTTFLAQPASGITSAKANHTRLALIWFGY